jgi:hypothetical protein
VTAYDVALKVVSANEENTKLAKQLAAAVIEALEREGWIGHRDDGLAMMKALRQRVKTAVMDPECPPRDLASLSRRLQDLNSDILELEDRLRDEGKLKDEPDDRNAGKAAKPARIDPDRGSHREFDPSTI